MELVVSNGSLFYVIGIIQGLEHERATKRIDFPRTLSLTKDKDAGADKLRLTELRQKLKKDCQSYFQNQISIGEVDATDSNESVYLQLADLFTGSISRVLNKSTSSNNHKDDFAKKALAMLGVNQDLNVQVETQDFIEIINIT